MAHRVNKINLGTNVALALVTFTSYTQGGESFTLAEFGLTGTLGTIFFLSTVGLAGGGASQEPEQYCNYVGGGIIRLMNVATPSQELPTTASMTFQVVVVVTLAGA